jgi:beta-galactosidase
MACLKKYFSSVGLRALQRSFLLPVLLLFLSITAHAQTSPGAKRTVRNDHIFPATPAVKPFIDFDRKGFLIHGKRTFIVCAGMEYARVPRDLWRDRLVKLKHGGFNAVEIYTFWNFHEPLEGKFDFSGDQDLNAFLKLVNELSMYAIVRVGPYYCGEWSFGGYPVWLKFKPGLRVRENNPQFLNAVDNYFDELIPVVAKNQIQQGGAVIMVQLENEHPAGWGVTVPNDYFRHLQTKILELGINVPYYFSGLHHGNDPGAASNLDDPDRPNPWFSSEYWSVWFFNYGPQPNDAALYDRRTWKILAHGGNAYSVYMAHGGSNFGYFNDRDMAASYDYGAAIGQAGDLRPLYYTFKRAGWFARSFQEILENSEDASSEYRSTTGDDVRVTARKSPSGTIAFIDNPKNVAVTTTVNHVRNELPAESVTLAQGEIMPVVYDFNLIPNVMLTWAPTRVYSIIPQGNTTTLLVHGHVGSFAPLYFQVPSQAAWSDQQHFRKIAPDILSFKAELTSEPTEFSFVVDEKKIRILLVSTPVADHTWFIEENKQTNIIVGSSYVSTFSSDKRQLTVVTEKSWKEPQEQSLRVYQPNDTAVSLTISHPSPIIPPAAIHPSAWKMKDASQPRSPSFNDKNWKMSDQPLQMGADGDVSPDAWYRTTVEVSESGTYSLAFKNIRDRAELFLDGKRIDSARLRQKVFAMALSANTKHHLTVFTAHDGRNKQAYYIGPLDTTDAKGITGPVTLYKEGTSVRQITKWRLKGGPGDALRKSGWQALTDQSVFDSPLFYKSTFIISPNETGIRPAWRVNTTSLGHGTVWVNGHNLGRYPEKIKINGLYIPENWLLPGPNTIIIYEEDGRRPDRVVIEPEMAAGRSLVVFSNENEKRRNDGPHKID